MNPPRLASYVIGFFGGALCALAAVSACTPKQGEAIKAIAPGVEKATCVVLVALEPKAAPFCATADDLAPYVDDLVGQLEAARALEPVASSSSPLLAVSLEAPKRVRHPAKRHCARWELVLPSEGGAADGSGIP